MNIQSFQKSFYTTIGLIAVAAASQTQAATITWGGSDGEYNTGTNWVGDTVPNTTTGTPPDTAIINGGAVTYTPGLDFTLNNGGTLQLNGGSFTQPSGGSFMQLSGGVLQVNGGAFSQGAAGNVITDSSTAFSTTAGSVSFSLGGDLNAGSFLLSGGTFSAANANFLLRGPATISGGVFNLNFLAMGFTGASLDFSGGAINIAQGSNVEGMWVGSNNLNFTAGSTGSLFIDNLSVANAESFLFNKVSYDGVAPGGAYATVFNLVASGNGVLITAVPEPSTAGLLALGGMGLLSLSGRRRAAIRG